MLLSCAALVCVVLIPLCGFATLHMCCFCLCSQAEGSWSKERCCAVQGNTCYSIACDDHTSSSDYLYRLSPGEPERYETIPGGNTRYQQAAPTLWPVFGDWGDLVIGSYGPPGANGFCDQGGTCRGSPNAACGGDSNWGHTDLEVWFI
eukprot:COSAG06_NODE_711_length_12877_cov_16.318281_12_plen_148_part_00